VSTVPVSGSERDQFAAAVHDLLSGADVPAAARRWADGDLAPGLALWRRLAALGVTALAVPEKCGGLGASPLDLVVACEELGLHTVERQLKIRSDIRAHERIDVHLRAAHLVAG